MSGIDTLKLDLEELQTLQQQATRSRVKEMLGLDIRKVQSDIVLREEKLKAAEPKPAVPTPEASTPAQPIGKSKSNLQTVKMTTYAWDQSDKFFKIYATLEKIQSIPAENVTCEFQTRSFTLRVKELDGKNYELTVTNLFDDIDPEKSKFRIKTGMVLVQLKKKEEFKTWGGTTAKEGAIKKPNLPKTDEEDPSASLMNMMKQMYDDGDDDMKRTIAQAWTQSKDKQGMAPGGPMDI
ncbi:unnamed protein product [Owenia fusiformis]|uniref:Calcyclin-binding protein n=1 Tax=Owenia fusiformis TaxID=6347 RepID=A0A8J1UI18_OWEFU|nr:unnamed protein product [Owenia fusiformis]